MAKERKASVIYEGNGTQQTFSFPFDYLRKAFIKAEIIESSNIIELEQGKDYSITDKELTLNSGVSVATGKLLKIYRETTTEPLVEWQDASILRSADLSLQEVQLLHLAEETADKVFDTGMSTSPTNTNVWDGQYKRITNLLDPQEDGDAVTLRYINSNKSNFINDLKSEGAKQNSSIVTTGDTQNSRLETTGDTQNKRLTDTGDSQNRRLTTTGDSYVNTMTSLKADATTQASTATTKANEAKNSATSASSSASTATTKANEAKNSATSASSSVSIATTKATEASNSAELAKKWAMSDSSPDGVSDNKSSKTWANEAKNSATSASSSASIATTKATEASNSASAAAKSARDAAIFDPSSYYTKEQTYTKTELNTGNSWFWNYLHRFGENYNLPTTNREINKLGVFSSYYAENNKIKNQPTQYGQLINIPSNNNAESAQLWIVQSSGCMYHRGGNATRNVNDIPFKRFLDTDDMKSIVALAYPVGSIYMNATDGRNPAEILGFGTWVQISKGRVLLGAGTADSGTVYNAGNTGGEEKHKLTVNELPAHNHSGRINSAGAHTHTIQVNGNGYPDGQHDTSENDNYYWRGTAYGSAKFKSTQSEGSHTHSVSIENTGGNNYHNNMQPYLVVYIFKRTA